jgi:hypothetical protein
VVTRCSPAMIHHKLDVAFRQPLAEAR